MKGGTRLELLISINFFFFYHLIQRCRFILFDMFLNPIHFHSDDRLAKGDFYLIPRLYIDGWFRDYSIHFDAVLFRDLLCRSEEHTSELQSRFDLVCRLLLEKKKFNIP